MLAASDNPTLASLDDEALLLAAARQELVLVTENARDFDRIVREWSARGDHHAGVVFTSPRRFHRGTRAYPDNLVTALLALLTAPPASARDWVHWLE